MTPSPVACSEWTTASPSFPLTLWRALVVSPGGLPRWVEVRAMSEAGAVAKLTRWLPYHTIQSVERRPSAR